ncbi:MAG: MBL fold metallo-hydrolase [Pirellulales bacterium]
MLHRRQLAHLLVMLAACATNFAVAPPASAGPQDKKLDVYWIDVEGGAATLLVAPTGETVLIDAGNPGRRDAERIVQVLTQVAGRRQIDHLVTTHFHGDHYGGAVLLSSLVPIRNVYDNGDFEGLRDRPDASYWKFPCERRIVIQPGDRLSLQQLDGAPPISITCLGTRQTFIPAVDATPTNAEICADARQKDRDGSDNANSVVLLVQFGDWRFFDAGDLTWNQEARLVCPSNLVGRVDVYQVTHHGLDASNNPLVLRTIQPRVAVMNNGVTKGCMPEVFETLQKTTSLQAIYQVHKNLRDDGRTNNVADEFIANRERECQGHYIRLSVAADAKSYSVAIPANQHERMFETVSK